MEFSDLEKLFGGGIVQPKPISENFPRKSHNNTPPKSFGNSRVESEIFLSKRSLDGAGQNNIRLNTRAIKKK